MKAPNRIIDEIAQELGGTSAPGSHLDVRVGHTALIRDGWRDSLMFSLLEDEWRTAAEQPSATAAE
ncbi:hypothetical protein ABZT17_18240 [Streptomyces sp. NPDC005648]|uniref:hypothetical protein n=1 Tax=Streptomyces sp. NPDC005648 TaxID=3157044 RepID=UPI0033BBD463